MSSSLFWSKLLLPVVVAAATCHAGVIVFQADGRHGAVEGGTNLVLTAFNGVRLFGNSDEWQKDANTGIIYNAAGSGALPLRIEANPETSGLFVKTLFIVTTNAPTIRLYETIVASKERFRMAGREANDLFNDEAVVDTGRFTIADWSVDLVSQADMTGGRKQLLKIIFHEAQPLEDIHFFGEGRAEWARAWRGGALEFMAFSGPDEVSEPVEMAVAHYFRLKYKLHHLQALSTPAGRSEAVAAGCHFGNYFSTLLILR